MSGQVRRRDEAFAAVLTVVRFVAHVDLVVQQTCCYMAETLPALVTAVRFLSRVDRLVLRVVGQ